MLTYSITLTGTHSGVGKFGFEVTSESSGPQKVGTWIITDPAQTKLTNSNSAATHTSGGTNPSGDSKSWTVDWTAPASGTGEVLFTAAFNAANGNGGTSGDVIYRSFMSVAQSTVGLNDIAEAGIQIYPNPATDYFVVEHAPGADMQIFDLNGRLIETRKGLSIEEKVMIDNFEAGLYFVVVKKDEESFNHKLIVK